MFRVDLTSRLRSAQEILLGLLRSEKRIKVVFQQCRYKGGLIAVTNVNYTYANRIIALKLIKDVLE